MRTVTERRVDLAPPGFAQGGPKTLAALRIATGLAALLTVRGLWGFVIPPESLRFPPPGTAWLSFLPVSQTAYNVAVVVLAVSATLVAAGWKPRWTASAAAVAMFYAGWITTLTGKVDHFHHVLWVLAILAVSPCANRWAVRRENRAGSYQWPVTAVVIIIGLVYFGAGLQKLTSAGLAWGWSDNLANTMLNMGWEKNQPVHQWLLDWPVVGRVMGMGALLFELSFLPLILHPKTRRLWPLGLAFHWGTFWVLGIGFWALQLMYVVFLPWDRRVTDEPSTRGQDRFIIGLLAAVTVFTVSGIDRAWPIAAYPGFENISSHFTTDIEVHTGGEMTYVTDHPVAKQVGQHRIRRLAFAAMDHNPVEFRKWLGADKLQVAVIDTSVDPVEPPAGTGFDVGR